MLTLIPVRSQVFSHHESSLKTKLEHKPVKFVDSSKDSQRMSFALSLDKR